MKPLIEALKDDAASFNASVALTKLTDKNFGKDYEKWLAWWKESSSGEGAPPADADVARRMQELASKLDDRKNRDVRTKSADVLKKITGLDIGIEYDKWRIWWEENLRASERVSELIVNLKDDDEQVRAAAAKELQRLRSDRAVCALIPLVKDETREARAAAARELGNIGDETASQCLVDALHDDYWCVRAAAAEALGRIADKSSIPRLKKTLEEDPDARVRISCAIALLRMECDESAFALLNVALKDKDVEVRLLAAQALAEVGDNRASEHLTSAMNDEDPRVRAAARDALTRIAMRGK